jgi:glycosyltransferase involved in cell wall biosynthesis
MLTIAHVLPPNSPVTFTLGGAVEKIVLSIADKQAKLGHDVRVFSANEKTSHERPTGLKIESVRVRLPRPFCDVEYLIKVRWRLRRHPVEILQANRSPLAAVLIGGSCRKFAAFDFFRFRWSGNTLGRCAYRYFLSRFDSISSTTEYSARSTADYLGLPQIPRVIHNGVDLTEFCVKPPNEFALPEIMKRKRIALYVGRINAQKGAMLLKPLAEAVARDGITIIACGPLDQFHVNNSGVSEDFVGLPVHYLGVVEQKILPSIMSAADVLLLPTIADEMFGMVLVEAGACGTPAIASDIDGIPEVIGDAGLLFPAGDLSELIEKVRELFNDGETLSRLSVLARANAEKFGWDRIVDDVMAWYEEKY